MAPSADPPSAPGDAANGSNDDDSIDAPVARSKQRTESMSQKSDNSQTAAEFIRDQMQLEADARIAMPYSIENCTAPLGKLRQQVFACLTCNPPPANPSDSYNAAGVCYACSVQCHGEHELVEIFAKRNFTCDCGTTRFPESSPCSLRINPKTNTKGGVHSETPDPNNKYNQNFRNRFCGCECDYDPFQQKGTMFQCLGLGTHETGGCGEDWWHPGCVVGLGPKWFENMEANKVKAETETKDGETNGTLPTIAEDGNAEDDDDNDPPPPPGFPAEDDFEGFICYKCVEAHPWIKRYAGSPGFLAPVFLKQPDVVVQPAPATVPTATTEPSSEPSSKKRKAEEDDEDADSQTSKRPKTGGPATPSSEPASSVSTQTCKLTAFPPAPSHTLGPFSLFFTDSFRTHLCRCPSCFPLLTPHPQLLEDEETYEPPVSEAGGSDDDDAASSAGSLYDRGESALRNNVDRVRAIEGVAAYQHMKEKLMPFFREFAGNGRVISAEDVKGYFAKLRGDEEAIREAGERPGREEGGKEGDFRKEGEGY
ncbi:protein mlo2 [Staphylotrichum tortipilum]|uniref:Protein mlo2 n=1 Tax=Staphylotrichum tortipilum TaxID=2831512 RepID=A0AAN6RW30_9PEZI|nr:protein mlo2 [Staphylotrichum longicolle]